MSNGQLIRIKTNERLTSSTPTASKVRSFVEARILVVLYDHFIIIVINFHLFAVSVGLGLLFRLLFLIALIVAVTVGGGLLGYWLLG